MKTYLSLFSRSNVSHQLYFGNNSRCSILGVAITVCVGGGLLLIQSGIFFIFTSKVLCICALFLCRNLGGTSGALGPPFRGCRGSWVHRRPSLVPHNGVTPYRGQFERLPGYLIQKDIIYSEHFFSIARVIPLIYRFASGRKDTCGEVFIRISVRVYFECVWHTRERTGLGGWQKNCPSVMSRFWSETKDLSKTELCLKSTAANKYWGLWSVRGKHPNEYLKAGVTCLNRSLLSL